MFARSPVIARFGFLGLLALASPALAQGADRAGPAARSALEQSSMAVVFEGFVLAPDGMPAEGAVVVSSAGGRTVADREGHYRLEVDVPLEAECVQVTAVGASAGLMASTSVPLSASQVADVADVDPLQLAQGDTCQPGWLPTFGEQPGTNDTIQALTAFDDGGGPALYVAGDFTTAGGTAASRVAKWDGTSWTALGEGVNQGVNALAVYDDGGGPALHAAGFFFAAGGVTALRIAKWDGTHWTSLGSGMNFPVHALTVYDDGGGPALYAGGDFSSAGGVAAGRIARWDGSSWSALGTGLNGSVRALTSHDDGSGPALYAGGTFTTAGGVAASRIARWDGTSWSALGTGLNGNVLALTAYDDGGGPALYAGGSFTTAGGGQASRIAKWDGHVWTSLGSGIGAFDFPEVDALSALDDGTGAALYVAGRFLTAGGVNVFHVARWDGSSWAALGGGVSGGNTSSSTTQVRALTTFDDGNGPAVCAGGNFSFAGGVAALRVARWKASSWKGLGDGLNDAVRALAVHHGAGGPALVAGGSFTTAGGPLLNGVAKWSGSSWEPLGDGLIDIRYNGRVFALAEFDDGHGPALYAGGGFGGAVDRSLAKWDGSSWSPLVPSLGPRASVDALTVHDDGSGPALFVGGTFLLAGGQVANGIAKWSGSAWATLGSGVSGSLFDVHALASFDDGGGPALYVGGNFLSAGGVPAARNIAKWDGSSWSALGSGIFADVHALAVYDDGSGPALYAGGSFVAAGGVPARFIAKWDGSSWSALGSGLTGSVFALTVYDDGSGPGLYAGGNFTSAGGVAANRIARWDGSSWTTLGRGVSDAILALTVFDGPEHGAALIAGGEFSSAFDAHDSFIARWQGCSDASRLDIRPGACPNSFNRKGNGVLPVALVGSDDFDVGSVDLSTIELSRADGTGGTVSPYEGPPGPHSTLEDAATPFDGTSCDCHALGGDGVLDLVMHFRSEEVTAALDLDELPAGALVELVASGSLLDGTPFRASDCIRLVAPGTPLGSVSVRSDAGAWIDALPPDESLDGGGFVGFERAYPLTTEVTLTAPRSVDGRSFVRWVMDGVPQAGGREALELVVTGSHTATAIYERHVRRR